ncbi:hypothetical protein EWM64_g6225 [Hericium alpestre]|uniref:Uncharacterized protein n=1 Tax=Hericium alpestre TaxID=135208 RepID=A0A4Y9ZUP7_9AGAM|nr:hypothetical protein EWM64_g6225 [Hericium alpestre]
MPQQVISNALQPCNGGHHAFEATSKSNRRSAKCEPHTVDQLRGKLRALMQASLVHVTNDPRAKMCWARYQQKIVRRYHIDAVRWPVPKEGEDGVLFKDLSKQTLHQKPLEQLVRSWELGHTAFRQLTEAEILEQELHEAHQQTRPISQHVDKGEARPEYQKGKAGRRKKHIHYTKSERFVEDDV